MRNTRLHRPTLFLALSALTALLSARAASAIPDDFVRARGGRLEVRGEPYRFVGANFWYGMNLGASGPGGDRPRLARELDRLKVLGITHLRVLAASEGPNTEPWRIVPALQPSPGELDPDVLRGLDFLMAELGKRGMRAVLCLGNFWPWSGGMAQYLRWAGSAGPIPYPPPAPGGSWERYQEYAARFYSDECALALWESFVRRIVGRTNEFTGKRYSDDPTVMAWELANEPRGIRNTLAFGRWIARSSTLIKSLDPFHLVTTGTEGETPWPAAMGLDFTANHAFPSIDYATAHIWAQNWGWYDPNPAHAAVAYPEAITRMRAYVREHLAKARMLGKPLVVEEFGLARDQGSLDPGSATRMRDGYFAETFATLLGAARAGEPVGGVAFWAWAGEARPRAPFGGYWRPGDAFTGDPPHEPQGWYGVYDTDRETLEVLRQASASMAAIGHKPAPSLARLIRGTRRRAAGKPR